MASALEAYKEQLKAKFKPASEFKGKYSLDKKPLGAGHFSKVYKANSVSRPNEEYAVKIINMSKLEDIQEVKALDNEIAILSQVEHPGIIKLYDVYSDTNEIWLVLEMAQGGELFQRIISRSEGGLYTEQEAAKIVRHVLEVLEYLHGKFIVHRDIKPENILLRDKDTDTRLKIADFGFAAFCTEPLDDPYGTPVYVAPEVLVGEKYTTTPDMWSVGVITYILLCGYPPFFHNDQETLARMIVRTGFRFDPEDWDIVSEDAKDFIRGLLKKNPRKRFSASDALLHPWIKNYSYGVTSIKTYLTINTELKKFRAELNLRKAFGAMRAFEKMRKLADVTKDMKVDYSTDSSQKVSHVELQPLKKGPSKIIKKVSDIVAGSSRRQKQLNKDI